MDILRLCGHLIINAAQVFRSLSCWSHRLLLASIIQLPVQTRASWTCGLALRHLIGSRKTESEKILEVFSRKVWNGRVVFGFRQENNESLILSASVS